MSAHRNDLEAWIEAYLDGGLPSDAAELLSERLRHDPEARRVYREMAAWHATLSTWGEQHSGTAAAAEFARVAEPMPFPRRSVFPAAALWAMAAAAAIALGAWMWNVRARSDVLAHVDFEREVEWAGHAPASDGGLQRRSYELKSGVVRFQTRAGATVTIASPAAFDFKAGDRIELHSGRLTARMLGDESRLTVKVGRMEVRDLGTAFGIDASNVGRTLVSVFDGLVAVTSSGLPGKEVRLAEGKSFVVPRDAGAGARHTPYDPDAFRDLWPLTIGVDDASSLVEFLPPGPQLRPLRDYLSNGRLHLFPEQQNAVLGTALEIDLSLEAPAWPNSPVSPYPLPRGARVDSFLVFYQPEAVKGQPRRLKGEITFQRPILGVICSDRGLDRSDHELGDKSADYLAPGQRRGLEEADKEHYRGGSLPHDSMRLSADGRTLTFDFYVSDEREQFRVLVAAH